MMKKTLLAAMAIASFVALSGCSSKPDNEMNQRLVQLQQQQDEMRERQRAMEQKRREVELNSLPDWILSPPDADATGYYGVGIAQSKNLQHVRRAARLQAEFELAKMYRQELSGSERAFSQGNTEGDVVEQTVFLIDKIVDAVPVVGYQVVEQVVEPIDGIYHMYILLKLPYDQFNEVLKQQRAGEEDRRIQSQFDDLERRLADRRQEREIERQRRHERELEQMRTRSEIMREQSDNANTQAETEVQQGI